MHVLHKVMLNVEPPIWVSSPKAPHKCFNNVKTFISIHDGGRATQWFDLTGDSKLTFGANGCLSLVQGAPHLSPRQLGSAPAGLSEVN